MNEFYRFSIAAMDANVMPVFWDLDPMTQAWIVATVETRSLIRQIRDFADDGGIPGDGQTD